MHWENAKGMSAMSRNRGASATSRASVQNARKNLTKFLKTLDTVPQEELQRAADAIRSEAILLAPYKTGQLERSIRVRVAKDKRRPGIIASASAKSETGYDYAGIQHEAEHFQHPIKGQAHFLSQPFNKEVVLLKARLKYRLKVPK